MTIEVANRLLLSSLSELYDERESASISSMVLEHLTGLPKSLRLMQKTDLLSAKQEVLFRSYIQELANHRPVQYVLKEAWFGPMSFYVDENVLIPRPETEELVDWLLKDNSLRGPGTIVMDIGTGSGCIPVYIKKKRTDFNVLGIDISEAALEIAKKNAEKQDVHIHFFQCDVRDQTQWGKIPAMHIIISNPPYIPEKQKQILEKHVRDFEPGLALFVPDDDPIIFYKLIGQIALQKLMPGGVLFLEIHHDYAKDIMDWYEKNGFTLELRKDFSGNNRMIKAEKF
ncbi:MAG TPA: peptide chain release factor N(5)-glutamine methyltransferase [Puia sp.]|nr:peptide chain release factor N(5)-glutamine methyltransferase [Puia sp.]